MSEIGVNVAGSWDDLLARASSAANGNAPETDELFTRLIARLNKLPEKILAAGDYHLVNVRDRAVARYAGWLVQSNRLEDAERLVMDDSLPLIDIDGSEWLRLRARLLSLLGKRDAADEHWNGLVDSTDDTDELVGLITSMIDTRHFVAAAQAIQKREQLYVEEPEYAGEDDAIGALLYAQMYAALNKPRETTLWLKTMLEYESTFLEFLDTVLSLGWNAGFTPQDVLDILKSKFLSKHQDDPAVLFWGAFANQRLGNAAQAHILWTRLTLDEKLHEVENVADQLWYFSVANYYLGDKKAMGIGAALDALSEGRADAHWTAFAATGLGWVLQEDENAALLNLQLAAQKYLGDTWLSRQLPGPWRDIAQDLMPAESFARFEHLFQKPDADSSQR